MTARKPLVADARVRMPDPFAATDVPPSTAGTMTRPVLGEDYRLVPLTLAIEASPLQTRATFDPDSDEDDRALLDSLRADGQRVPVLLVEARDGEGGYRLLDGHRRVEALRKLGQDTVRAIIQRAESLSCDLTTLTANVRKNLSPLEQARAIERLHERHGLTWKVIAQKTGLTTRWLRELRGLLSADASLIEAVEEGQVTARTAIELKAAPREQQSALAQVAAANKLSAATAAKLVSHVNELGKDPRKAATALGLSVSKPGERPSRAEAARWLLSQTFPELDEQSRRALVEAVALSDEKDNVIKLAALLVLGGDTVEEALKHARMWVRAGGIRQLIAVVDGLARLQGRPIVLGVEMPPWKAGLARKVATLP